MTSEEVPFINVGAFDRVEASGEATKFVEWMSHQRRRGSDPTLHLLDLNHDDVVLDVGCGPGTDLATTARSARLAIGIDRSASMATAASEATSTVATAQVLVGEAQQLPFGDGAFTAANCRAVLIHAPQPRGGSRRDRPRARLRWTSAVLRTRPRVPHRRNLGAGGVHASARTPQIDLP